MSKIFISIASYRDPQLIPTIKDCIAKAKYPNDLVFSIAWQHDVNDTWDSLQEYCNDPRFKIIDIPYQESNGACWARSKIQENYSGEEYYFQLDSHHRFIENWDRECIDMIKQLQEKGHNKPLLTGYISSFDPDNDPEGRVNVPWRMTFDRFIPEGAVFFLPEEIPGWKDMTEPVPARFLSAHFIFTLGQFAHQVPYDPEYYFHGEEISLSARSFTWGYDLFHPHKVIAWHEYARKGRTKHWDDDKQWSSKNSSCHKRNRILFGMDGECRCQIDFGKYGFCTIRSLQDYEKYAGLQFNTRRVHKDTLGKLNPTYDFISDEYHINNLSSYFKHCIDIYRHQVPEIDYEYWVVAFHDIEDNTIYRKDLSREDINILSNDPDDYYKIFREFDSPAKPAYWIVWPYSTSKGWCERIKGDL